MIVLWHVAIALLSFTPVPMWVQIALILAPPALISAVNHDPVPVAAGLLAVIGALVSYTPLAFLASFLFAGGFRAAFRRLRFIFFVIVILLFTVLVFNLSQLI